MLNEYKLDPFLYFHSLEIFKAGYIYRISWIPNVFMVELFLKLDKYLFLLTLSLSIYRFLFK